MESILSELSGLAAAAPIPEEEDSMETQTDVPAVPSPLFEPNVLPSSHTEEIGVLVLMMAQLLECIKMGPMLSVHIVANKCAKRLDAVVYLVNVSRERNREVTTEEVVKVLILHQSIKGLINICPHTFIVAQLEDYISETESIIQSLSKRYKEQIVDERSDTKSLVTCVQWP